MEKIYFPEIIESSRIVLRKHSLDSAQTMFSYIDQDRMRLRQFLPWVDLTTSVQDTIDYIHSTHKNWSDYKLFDYSIFARDSNTYLGNAGVHSIAWNHERCELGYWILGDYEGKGYVSEASRALEQTSFDLGFNRVEIRCSSLNKKSASVPIRLGYRLEGVLAQDSIEMGRLRDTMIFGKLKSDSTREPSPALQGLAHVYIFVENILKSAAWYEKALGSQATEKDEKFALFRLGQSELCLHLAGLKSPVSSGGSVGYWRTPDLKTTIQHFESHGGRVYRGPISIGSGQGICQIQDPFGSVIGLVGAFSV